MKKLVVKLFLLLFPFITIFAFLEVRLYQVKSIHSIKREFLESQLKDIKILSTGSSHGYGIDPEYFDQKGFTLFNISQDLFYDVNLVNKYFDQMPNLKMVIIPISYFSLEFEMDKSSESWRSFFYTHMWGINPEEFSDFFNARYFSLAALYGRNKIISLITNNFVDNGVPEINKSGWWPSGNTELKDEPANITENESVGIKRVTFHNSIMHPELISKYVKLLSKLIEYCQSRDIQVVLITTPVSHYYYDHLDPIRYQRMQENIQKFQDKYGVPYFNYLKDSRFVSSDMYDTDHLNARGAEKFSKIINDEIIKKMIPQ